MTSLAQRAALARQRRGPRVHVKECDAGASPARVPGTFVYAHCSTRGLRSTMEDAVSNSNLTDPHQPQDNAKLSAMAALSVAMPTNALPLPYSFHVTPLASCLPPPTQPLQSVLSLLLCPTTTVLTFTAGWDRTCTRCQARPQALCHYGPGCMAARHCPPTLFSHGHRRCLRMVIGALVIVAVGPQSMRIP
jgi:hypothetical protein